MRITFQTKNREEFYIDFGFHTPMFNSMYFITWGKIYYDEDNQVEWADCKGIIKHPKYWLS
jgi:hypothetical protein